MKLLIISYYYPPQKGIGGKRLFRFASRLPALGIDPVVLTSPWPPPGECDAGQPYEAPGVVVDRGYVPEWVWRRYHHTDGTKSGPGPIARLISRIDRIKGPSIDAMAWFVPFAVRRARELAKQHRFDAILSTSAPYSSHIVAMRLAEQLRIPFYADLRDPWTFNFIFRKRSARWRERDRHAEASVFGAARKVIFASKATENKYAELYPAYRDKLLTIYSGFDTDDGASSVADWPFQPRPRVAIAHFGRFYGDRRLEATLSSIRSAIQMKQLTPADLQLLILGEVAKADVTQLQTMGLESFIKIAPMMPYEQGLAVLRGADARFICDYGLEPYLITGNTFDYFRIRRPIFALSANAELCSLIQSTRTGRAIHPDDEAAPTETWLDLTTRNPAQVLEFEPNEEALARLSADDSARQLAHALTSG